MKENPTSTLEDQIDELRELWTLRTQAGELHAAGRKALSNLDGYKDPPRDGWSQPSDFVEPPMLLKVLRSAKPPKQLQLRKLGNSPLREFFKNKQVYLGSGDHVPVLRAAVLLESFASLPGFQLKPGAVHAFARIIYELKVVSSEGIQGGAGAGAPGTPQTAFITWRCARALIDLRASFRETARFTALLAEMSPNLKPPFAKPWFQVDQEIKASRADVAFLKLQGFLLADIPTFKSAEIEKFTSALTSALRSGIQVLEQSAITLEGMGNIDISAKNQAVLVIKKLIAKLQKGVRKKGGDDALGKLSGVCRDAADIIAEQFVPMRAFLRAVLDHELASRTLHAQRVPDVAELLFAADGLGRLENHDPESLRAALAIAEELMTNNGRVPSHKPFDVMTKGYVLHVAAAEALDAFAGLAIKLDYKFRFETATKMLSHFAETFRDDPQFPGWRHERYPEGLRLWWLSAISVEALGVYRRMLEGRINSMVCSHLTIRQPADLKLDLQKLFYPDYGLAAIGIRDSLALDLLRLQAHVSGVTVPGKNPLRSAVLYGPPGTGKTTLVEALAKSAGVPLVEVTPSDIILGGEEKIEARARTVFEALSMLNGVVILLDEFDSVLWDRAEAGAAKSIFQFLTPGMLPKLKALNEHAETQKMVFALSTNLIGALDLAAIRDGRFDKPIGVFPPDVLSREGRLFSISKIDKLAGNARKRFRNVIVRSAGLGMNRLGRKGWFSGDSKPGKGTPLRYLQDGSGPIDWPEREGDLPETPVSAYSPANSTGAAQPGHQFPNKYAYKEWYEWVFIEFLEELYKESEDEFARELQALKTAFENCRPKKDDPKDRHDVAFKRLRDSMKSSPPAS